MLRQIVNRDPRKVLPVAFVARQFSVSERLLWNWIAGGYLRTQKPHPGSAEKKGAAKSAVISFLRLLEEAESNYDRDWFSYVSRAGRPDKAMSAILHAKYSGNPGNGMKPAEYARVLGVSRTSVMRAIHGLKLAFWKPTPCRYLLGKRPRFEKKKNNY